MQLRRAERTFWSAIDALHVPPALPRPEFKQLVLGIVFLRYLSEALQERRLWLEIESTDVRSVYFCVNEEQRRAMLEREELYRGSRLTWVPRAARWERLAVAAREARNVGRVVDAAIISIEQGNPHLVGLFPEDYSRPSLPRDTLASVIALVDGVTGSGKVKVSDVLQRICEGFALTVAPSEDELPRSDRSSPGVDQLLQGLERQLKMLDTALKDTQAGRRRR